jgi:hypothetical protein
MLFWLEALPSNVRRYLTNIPSFIQGKIIVVQALLKPMFAPNGLG